MICYIQSNNMKNNLTENEKRMVDQMVSGFQEHCLEEQLSEKASNDQGEFYDYIKTNWGHDVAHEFFSTAWNVWNNR